MKSANDLISVSLDRIGVFLKENGEANHG